MNEDCLRGLAFHRLWVVAAFIRPEESATLTNVLFHNSAKDPTHHSLLGSIALILFAYKLKNRKPEPRSAKKHFRGTSGITHAIPPAGIEGAPDDSGSANSLDLTTRAGTPAATE
jgi:hypothetical protein